MGAREKCGRCCSLHVARIPSNGGSPPRDRSRKSGGGAAGMTKFGSGGRKLLVFRLRSLFSFVQGNCATARGRKIEQSYNFRRSRLGRFRRVKGNPYGRRSHGLRIADLVYFGHHLSLVSIIALLSSIDRPSQKIQTLIQHFQDLPCQTPPQQSPIPAPTRLPGKLHRQILPIPTIPRSVARRRRQIRMVQALQIWR